MASSEDFTKLILVKNSIFYKSDRNATELKRYFFFRKFFAFTNGNFAGKVWY
jgi:hypothetical protein